MDDKKKLQRANNKYNKYIEDYAKKEKKYKKGTLSEDEFKDVANVMNDFLTVKAI